MNTFNKLIEIASKTKWFCLAAVIAVALCVGCGGSNSPVTPSAVTRGVWTAAYNRGAGSVVVAVLASGSSATVQDSTGGSFTGKVSVGPGGAIAGTLSGTSGTVSIGGTISGTGSSSTIVNGSISGAFAASYVGTYAGSGETNIFAGNYSGSFSGTDSGSFSISVDGKGVITGTSSDQYGYQYNITGSVGASGTGSAKLDAAGGASGNGGSATWSGTFLTSSNLNTGKADFDCLGSWFGSQSGEYGTWNGSMSN